MNYPILGLIVANVIWGAAAPIFKFALGNIPPFTLAFIRFFGAGLLLAPLAVVHRQRMRAQDWVNVVLAAFFGIAINISFFFLGLQRAPSINAPIIISSAPLLLFLFAVIFLKEKPASRVFLGMLIALVGDLIIILSPLWRAGQSLIFGEIQGNLFFLLAVIGIVLMPLFNKKVLGRVNIYQVTCLEFLIAAVIFFPLMINELQTWSFGQLTSVGWTGIIYGIFFSSSLAYFLFNYGTSRLNTQEIGLFFYVDPITALIIAVVLLHEYPTIYYGLGTLLVFLGIFIAERRLHYHPVHKLTSKK